MKKKITLVTMLLAFFLVGINVTKVSAASSTTLKPEVLYSYDFEGLEVDTTNDGILNDKNLMWFESTVSAKIVDVSGNHKLQYTIEDNSGGFTPFGGIGTGAIGNLAKLIGGKKYHFSMYIDTTNTQENSTFWVEYQADVWVGAKISNGTVEPCDANNISNLSYVDNVLEFDFIGYDHGGNLDKGWIKLTGQNMEIYDKVYVDDLSITRIIETGATFTQNFDELEVGLAATPSSTNIPNVWNSDAQSLTIAEEDGNKFLHLKNTTDSQAWPKFYFNNLPLVSGVEYCLEFDILSHNFDEFYICYNESGTAELTYTYGPTSFIGGGGNAALGDTSFDGKHLSVIFTPSDSFGQFWPQVALISKHSGTLDLKIDNVNITKTSQSSEYVKSITTNVTEVNLCIGKELTFDELEVTLTRNNETTRVLTSDEYIIDTSKVNKEIAGEYSAIITVVDEFGNNVTTSMAVNYNEHNEVVDEAVEATCTQAGKTEGKHCSTCDEVLVAQEEVAALGHTEVVDAAVEATCTQVGKTEGKHCSTCDEVLVAQEEVVALGHTEVVDAAVEATCTEAGLTEGKHCSVCNEVLVAQEAVAAGHKEVVDAAVAATCTEKGKTEGKHCSVCDEVLVAQEEVAALGHTEVKDAAVAATCSATGKTEGKHCSVCNEVLVAQEEVAKVAHTEVVDAAVEATCTTAGKTEGKHCSVCNEVLVAQEEVAATGHSYDDEYDANCNTCNETREVPEKPASGCKGSIFTSILGMLVLTGATLVLAKRKREE